MNKHTLSVLVENVPGVLARVASLFSRRAFNIDSLAVGETENPEVSRITIVVNCADHPLEHVTKQLNKLVNVIKIVELEPTSSVQRELLLVKIRADAQSRPQVMATLEPFSARIVDVSIDALTIEATGESEKLAALLRVLEPFGVKEMVQSGMVAISRTRVIQPHHPSAFKPHRPVQLPPDRTAGTSRVQSTLRNPAARPAET